MFNQAAQELTTVRDLLRFAVSRFNDAGLFFGHGSDNAHDEAAYLILHTLNLPLDTLEPYLDAKLLQSEKEEVLSILERRAVEHIPAAYLTHQAWQGEFDFYVDERVIVPRSFIYELLGDGIRPWIEHDELVHRALDLCTGSGCLAIQMAHHYPDAQIDAVDLSLDALEVAAINIEDYGLEDRITFINQDIRQLKGIIPKDSVDFITCNPPYFKVKETNQTNLKEAYTIARHEVHLPLEDLLETISGLLKMKGKAYLVHRPDRLTDILTEARNHRLEAKRVQFVYPKEGKESNIVLIELMKDGLPGGLKVLPPITVFNEDQEYTQKIRSILWGDES